MKTTTIVSGALLTFWVPVVALAQEGLNFQLESQLRGIGSFPEFFLALLNIFITIATPIVAIAIIFAGFKYVTARGNAQQIGEATRALTYAVIGGLLLIGAVAIAGIISNLITALSSGG